MEFVALLIWLVHVRARLCRPITPTYQKVLRSPTTRLAHVAIQDDACFSADLYPTHVQCSLEKAFSPFVTAEGTMWWPRNSRLGQTIAKQPMRPSTYLRLSS